MGCASSSQTENLGQDFGGMPGSQLLSNKDKSKLQALDAQFKNSQENFQDPEFSHDANSLSLPSHQYYSSYFSQAQWLRPTEIFQTSWDNIKLFDTIQPGDILQGALGTCYFLATMSALAEFPDRIKRVFNQQEINQKGYYSLTFYVKGIPTEVIVDDYIPCYNNQPLFTKPKGNEMWCLLLEKAWCKLHEKYANAEGGFPGTAMTHITGEPSKDLYRSSYPTFFSNIEKVGDFLSKTDKAKGIMCAGSKGQGETKKDGIVAGHAYTIIDVYDFNYEKVLKMRNPWGKFEYNGKYSETSNQWTQEMKDKANFVIADDGIFYMTVNEFLDHFDQIAVQFFRDNYHYSYKEVKDTQSINKASQSYFYGFSINQETEVSLRFHQLFDDFAKLRERNAEYSAVDFQLFYQENSSAPIKLLSSGDNDKYFGNFSISMDEFEKEFSAFQILKPGDYYIKAKCYSHIEDGFAVSAYSKIPIQLNELSKENAKQIMNQYVINEVADQNSKATTITETQQYKISKFDVDRTNYFLVENLTDDQTITVTVEFQLTNMQIYHQHRKTDSEMVITLSPKQKVSSKVSAIIKAGQTSIRTVDIRCDSSQC